MSHRNFDNWQSPKKDHCNKTNSGFQIRYPRIFVAREHELISVSQQILSRVVTSRIIRWRQEWGTKRDLLEDLDIDSRIILKLLLNKSVERARAWFTWLRIWTGGGLLWIRSWTFRLHQMRGISWIAETLLRFRERLRSTVLAKSMSTSTAVADIHIESTGYLAQPFLLLPLLRLLIVIIMYAI